ncbi:hypothetical protein IQ07DRAFT_437274 [Pyrenochaeta sp. DS3sAY3a]|nr:hypothetical protein IQ07DRAFT_437274 [Pyrenochaeta sp. DS3sAY3a]
MNPNKSLQCPPRQTLSNTFLTAQASNNQSTFFSISSPLAPTHSGLKSTTYTLQASNPANHPTPTHTPLTLNPVSSPSPTTLPTNTAIQPTSMVPSSTYAGTLNVLPCRVSGYASARGTARAMEVTPRSWMRRAVSGVVGVLGEMRRERVGVGARARRAPMRMFRRDSRKRAVRRGGMVGCLVRLFGEVVELFEVFVWMFGLVLSGVVV